MILPIKVFTRPLHENLCLFAYVVYIFSRILNTSQFAEFTYWMIIYATVSLLVLIFLLFSFLLRQRLNGKTFKLTATLSLFAAIVWIHNNKSVTLFLAVFMIASLNIPYQHIFKGYLVATLAAVALVHILYATGIFYYDFRLTPGLWGVRFRHYLGFQGDTYTPNYFFHFLIIFFAIKKRSVNLLETMIVLLVNQIIYALTMTQAVYFEVYLLVVSFWMIRLFPRICKTRLFKYATIWTLPLTGIAGTAIQIAYRQDSVILETINQFLSGRLSQGRLAIDTYGIHPFGAKVVWLTGRYGIDRTVDRIYVDMSFLNILITFGWIVLIFVCIGFMLIGKQCWENENYGSCIALLFLAMHSFSDPQLLDLKYDPFILLIGTAYLQLFINRLRCSRNIN